MADMNLDGFVSSFERELWGRLLSMAAIRVPNPPRYDRDGNSGPQAIREYADANLDGRISERELYDLASVTRNLITGTEVVTNPLEARYDLDGDHLLWPGEREAVFDELIGELLPAAIRNDGGEIRRWLMLSGLDENGDGEFSPEELAFFQIGTLNPRAFFFKPPESELERLIDNDPENGLLEPHEIFTFIDGVFATALESWLDTPGPDDRYALDAAGMEDEFSYSADVLPDVDVDDPMNIAVPEPVMPMAKVSTSAALRSSSAAPPDDMTESEEDPANSGDASGQSATEPVSVEDMEDGLSLQVNLQPVFPVLYEYYVRAPVGNVLLSNTGTSTLRNVSAKLRTVQYMDIPLTGETVSSVAPGQQASLNLRAMFNSSILTITEGTAIAAEITVSYESELGSGQQVLGVVLQIYDRNAVRWDDDRKVAAYVTSRNADFINLCSSAVRIVESRRLSSISRNFQEAMVLYSLLRLRDPVYRSDPSSSYSVLSGDSSSIDYVRYPFQTWKDGAGDCDDLSVLYCTMLETLGIPSAFVTVPGHILPAFKLEIDSRRAVQEFDHSEDFIIDENGAVWVPIEVTVLDYHFSEAWNSGALTWQDYYEQGSASLIPTVEAWKLYDPVQSPFSDNLNYDLDETGLAELFGEDFDDFIRWELSDRESDILASLASETLSDNARLRLSNRLGCLYALYGKTADAGEILNGILEISEYPPALVNLGNISFLEAQFSQAGQYYRRALAVRSDYPQAILGAARADYELGNFDTVASLYYQLETLDPSLAADYRYLDRSGSSTAQSRASRSLSTEVEWVQTDD
jgi:hypothetical protein